MAAEIVLDLEGLVARHDEVVAFDLADDAEPLEPHPDRAQMLDAGPRDAQRRTRHRGEPDQRADLDMVGLDRIAGGAERRRSVHDHGVGADALDAGAERDQEMREVLHMRLGGGVAQIGGAMRRHRGHQRVFRGRHAGLVEENVGAPELARRRNSSRSVAVTVAPSCSKARKCVSSRRRPMTSPPGGGSITSPQRASSGPASRIEARIRAHSTGIEIGGANVLGVDGQRVARPPFGRRADRADQLDQRFGVANPGHVFEGDRMLGQQRRRDDRQRGVLVAGRLDGARQPVTAFNDVLKGRHLESRAHTSTLALSALSWMNSRRGSTTSPISLVKMSSASSTSLIFTCSSERALVSSVVSQSCSGFISPRPL